MLGQYDRGRHCSVASKKANFARVEKAGVTRVTGVAEVHGDGGQETEDRRQKTEDRRQETGDRRQETGDRRQETPIVAVKFFVACKGDDFTIDGPKSLDPIL